MEAGLRERKKQQTRELIAQTARDLFVAHGFDAVRVAEIAAAADVSEKTVFNYFPTKEDLVFWRLESFEDFDLVRRILIDFRCGSVAVVLGRHTHRRVVQFVLIVLIGSFHGSL